MSDRDLLVNLSLVAGTLLRHPQSLQARRAVRNALKSVRRTFDDEARNDRRPAQPKPRRTGWLPYKDD